MKQGTPDAAAGPVLAFDYGLKRTGVAVGEPVAGTARALATLDMGNRIQRWQAIDRLLREWEPSLLVVGLPLGESGEEQVSTRRSRNFARELHQRYGLPVKLVDERFTSLEAQSILRERGLSAEAGAQAENGEAAALILRSYLESKAS